MAISEIEIMKQIQTLSRGGVRLFRNNVGFDAQNKVKYGLMTGSSDLIGWTQIEITPHHVGKKAAQKSSETIDRVFNVVRPGQRTGLRFPKH